MYGFCNSKQSRVEMNGTMIRSINLVGVRVRYFGINMQVLTVGAAIRASPLWQPGLQLKIMIHRYLYSA